MKKVNDLVLCRDCYDDEFEFKEAILDSINILLDNDYIATIRYDDKGLGIIVIEYDYNDKSMCDYYPCWLSPEDENFLETASM